MTGFEASFHGPSEKSFFGIVGVARRITKVLPVKVLSLDGLIVPETLRACTNKPTSVRSRSES